MIFSIRKRKKENPWQSRYGVVENRTFYSEYPNFCGFFNSINTKVVNSISIVNIYYLISGETVSKMLHNFYMHSYSHLCILPHVFKQQNVI